VSGDNPQEQTAPAAVVDDAKDWVTGDDLQPGDAYMEGPYVVFTAQFHLRRGYCCNSQCRHCPYR